jgi:hypothetical protein
MLNLSSHHGTCSRTRANTTGAKRALKPVHSNSGTQYSIPLAQAPISFGPACAWPTRGAPLSERANGMNLEQRRSHLVCGELSQSPN